MNMNFGCRTTFSLGVFIATGIFALTAPTYAAPPAGSARHSAVVDIAERLSPAIVTIGQTRTQTVSPFEALGGLPRIFGDDLGRNFFFGSSKRTYFLPYVGSGFIVDEKSLIGEGPKSKAPASSRFVLTNYHVIQGAEDIVVTLTDGREYPARLLDADAVVDVALLRIDLKPGESVATAKLGNSDDIMVGESVVALGNPFGPLIEDPHPTVTVGVVSAVNRSFQLEVDQRTGNARVYRGMIQTDASVNPGNSGGALVNFDGEVIGINTFIIAPGGGSSGVNFAIPINRAVRVAHEIIEYGEVRTPYLDFDIRAVGQINRDLLRRWGVNETDGLLIWRMDEKGPAMKAGLELGDVIHKVEGRTVSRPEDLIAQIISRTVGEGVTLTIARAGKTLEILYVIPSGPSRV